MSFPDITTISRVGSMRCLIWRKTSRILRFTRLRATAFPIFLEAMTPSLFRPNSLGSEKMVHNLSTRLFFPSAMTFSNSGRLTSRSIFLKEKFPIYLARGQRAISRQAANNLWSAIRRSSVSCLFVCGSPICVFPLRLNFVYGSRAHVFALCY